jgi:hypothetical protein
VCVATQVPWVIGRRGVAGVVVGNGKVRVAVNIEWDVEMDKAVLSMESEGARWCKLMVMLVQS